MGGCDFKNENQKKMFLEEIFETHAHKLLTILDAIVNSIIGGTYVINVPTQRIFTLTMNIRYSYELQKS